MVMLNWQTGSEKDLWEFVIERGNGNAFQKIASAAADNNATGNSYSFADPNHASSASYYRIKAVNYDGTYTYTTAQQVKGTGRTGEIAIYPNPAHGSTQISLGDIAAPVIVYVLDNSGRLVKSITSDKNIIELDGLAAGLYMVRVVDNTTGTARMSTLAVTN
jgi:hypothetical protein